MYVSQAAYEVRTLHSIALTFKSASVGRVRLGADLQNLLASPLLPRGMWAMDLLMGLRDASVSLPLAGTGLGPVPSARGPVGTNYLLTYLDGDTLIGRASQGTFVFRRCGDKYDPELPR
jgi:hypothetical protein